MTLKSERLRQRMADLQAELQEAEKVENRRARERAQRTLARAARRSGLLAALSQREGVHAAVLEREFGRLADRIDDSGFSPDAASTDRPGTSRSDGEVDEMAWNGGESE